MKKLMLLASVCLMLTSQAAHSKTLPTAIEPNVAVTTNDTDDKGEPRTYKMKLGNSKDQKVVISMLNSNINVIGSGGDELVIETTSYNDNYPPKQAEGLKPLYNQVEDNTKMGLGVTKEGNTTKIIQAGRHGGKYTIRLPKNVSVTYREINWNGGNFNLSDIDGEIEIKLNNGSASLTNVSGPVVAHTTNGGLKVKFTKVDQNKPSSISSINGDVDITMPANTKANLKLRSINGEIYTDFDLNLKNNNKSDLPKIGGGNNIDGQINGGGVEMSVNTINNNVFIRKAK